MAHAIKEHNKQNGREEEMKKQQQKLNEYWKYYKKSSTITNMCFLTVPATIASLFWWRTAEIGDVEIISKRHPLLD